MSEAHVEIVRRGFMAVLAEDWPTALATLDPIPDAGVYREHTGFREWLSNWSESWEEWRIDDLEFRRRPMAR